MKLIYTLAAARQLQKLPAIIQKRISHKMRFYLNQPDPLYFAKPLTNSRLGLYRFRVGEYRVVCDMRDETLLIVKIAKRDQVYS